MTSLIKQSITLNLAISALLALQMICAVEPPTYTGGAEFVPAGAGQPTYTRSAGTR